MSQDMVYEDVPRLVRRVGDNLVAGTNNATILLGRDRLGSVDSGYGSRRSSGKGIGAGAIHSIVGRKSEDPSITDDAATVYISARTDPDLAAGTLGIGTQDRITRSAVIMRADCVRISPRADLKISVGNAFLTMDQTGAIIIEGDVSLGVDAAERIIRGDAFATFWNTVTLPTPMGPSGPPPPLPNAVFSPRNKVK